MSLPCVGGCIIRDEHLSNCTGFQQRHDRLEPCTGCLPAPSERGLLCYSCAAKFDDALDVLCDLVSHMRSIERASAETEIAIRTAPGSRVIVPTSWLMADDVWAALHELAYRCDPLDFLDLARGNTTAYGFSPRDTIEHVRDVVALAVEIARGADLVQWHTASLAVDLIRETQRALAAFPLEERAHRITRITCRKCGLNTLDWKPPLAYLDLISVQCANPNCGAIFDPAIAEIDLRTLREDMERQLKEAAQ